MSFLNRSSFSVEFIIIPEMQGLLTFAETNRALMNKQALRLFFPAILIFFILLFVFWIFKDQLENQGIDTSVLMTGNMLVFLVTFISYLMETRGLASASNPAFLRMFYGSFFLKLVILVAAAFIYFVSAKKNLNKPVLFICMALYVIYSFFEVRALMKIGKKKHV